MIGKLMLLGLIAVFAALAIMFDWFGARDWTDKIMSSTEQQVETLSEKGDQIKELIDVQTNK
jgi:hypothetical protein